MNHKDTYNIRVVNMSLSGPVTDAYWNNPINQAVERLWGLKSIVVVAAVGSTCPDAGSVTTPGNDQLCYYGWRVYRQLFAAVLQRRLRAAVHRTLVHLEAGFIKPDVLAPGAHLLMYVGENSTYAQTYPHLRRAGGWYQGSGTSAATAVTSGVVALMLQQNPDLTPDQVKYRLMIAAQPSINSDGTLAASIFQQGAGRIWAPDAVLGSYEGESQLRHGAR